MEQYQNAEAQRRRAGGRARARHEQRQARRTAFDDGNAASTLRVGDGNVKDGVMPSSVRRRLAQLQSFGDGLAADGRATPALTAARDLGWFLRHRLPILPIAAGIAALWLLWFIAVHSLGGQIYPNVRAMGVDVGGMNAAQAQAALDQAWQENTQITLNVNGVALKTVAPAVLGLQMDSAALVTAARAAPITSGLFGHTVVPQGITLDYQAAQNMLLDLTLEVDQRPFNAGYQWQGAQLVGIAGGAGRALNIAMTLGVLQQSAAEIVARGRLDLIVDPLPPDMSDPAPYLEQARQLTLQPPIIAGYDPYTNQTLQWTTSPEAFASWLEVQPSGLGIRTEAIAPFVQGITNTLGQGRYIEPTEAAELVQVSLQTRLATLQDAAQRNATPMLDNAPIGLRIRYQPQTYAIERGDTGFRIARKTGIPFYLIQEANPQIDWENDLLIVGQTISVPSRDATMPQLPLQNKRIVVDLDRQMLYAYENNQLVFSWAISSGQDNAPTSPGIYQILNHNETAYGSSNTLCDAAGLVCGQWEMYWFMGIYEVQPGLVNGFHGAVLLPNGNYLGGEYNVGAPYTFGCVMSQDDNAKLLYDWAEVGTVVEIISTEYAPMSDLAKQATQQT